MTSNALFVLAALLLCTSCSKQQTWSYSELDGTSANLTPAKIQALSSLPYVQLELARLEKRIVGHINFLYHQIDPSDSGHPDLIEVNIKSGEETKSFLCTRLKGGGRLLLSKEATDFLCNALEIDKIELSIAGHAVSIESDGFVQQLKKLKKIDGFKAPIPSFGVDWN